MARSASVRLVLGLSLGCVLSLARCLSAADDAGPPFTADELFDGQRLLKVEIEVADPDWTRLTRQTLSFVTAFRKGAITPTYTYFPAQLSLDGRRIGPVEIRKKGFFGSMDQDRPGLKVKVKNDAQARLLAGMDRLTINNNKQDRALVSQYLSYRLFAAAGLPAPRCSLATLSVNGKPLGVYTHVESIDSPFLMRVFGSESGNLYEGVFPTDFVADRIERFEGKLNRKDNDRSDLREIATLLENPGDDFAERIARLIDLDQFITYWALESLIGFWDGYANNQNNYYLYRDPRDSRFRFIPWGTDMTMVPPFFPTGGNKSVYAKGQLAYQLNQDPAIRQKYHATLLKLLDTVWKEDQLLAEVDRIEALAKDHLHPAQGGLDQAANTTRTFIKNRRAEILEEIKEGPIHVTIPPGKSFYMRETGTASSTFSTKWTPAGAKEPFSSDKLTLEIELNDEKVQFATTSVTSGPSRLPNFGGPPGPPPPTVVLTGVRKSDQKKLNLTLTFTPDQFQADPDESISVQGALFEGDTPMFGPGMRSFLGTVKLKAAGQDEGASVEGTVTGTLYEIRGGFGG